MHLDAGYDYQPCRQVLAERGMVGQIATRGVPAPIQAGRRWVIERTHARANQCGLRAMVTGVLRCGYDPATHGFDGEPAFRLRWQTERDDIRADGLLLSRDGIQLRLPWSEFTGMDETPRLLLLILAGNRPVFMFPKRGLGDPAAVPRLREYLAARVAPRPTRAGAANTTPNA